MYKFYWSNLQKQGGGGGGSAGSAAGGPGGLPSIQQQQHQQQFNNSDQTPVWTRQNGLNNMRRTDLSPTKSLDSNPEPLPARGGRPTTVRVTSSSNSGTGGSNGSGVTDPHDVPMRRAVAQQQQQQQQQQPSDNNRKQPQHAPTGSHRVLLKLRRGANAARPKSVHGAEQVMASSAAFDNHNSSNSNGSCCRNNRFDGVTDETPSILETLASLRSGELPTAAKSAKRPTGGLPNSKSLHQFYSRTWTEKTLQRYQHNYENVYGGDGECVDNNDNCRQPVYENLYFRHGDSVDNAKLVIGQMAQSPRSAARMRHHEHNHSTVENGRQFNPPPEPNRSPPPVPPERKSRSGPKNGGSSKPLYRSKSCERPKMKDAMRDTFRISSDKFQTNLSRLSSNFTDKLSVNVMQRFSTGGCGVGSMSTSSRLSTGSTDVSSTNSTSVDNQNSLLQSVALKAIPCVDIQSHGSLSGGSDDGANHLDEYHVEDEYHRRQSSSSSRPALSLANRMRDIRQDVQKRFSKLRSRSVERLSQRQIAAMASADDRQSTAADDSLQHDDSYSNSFADDQYDEEATPTAARPAWTPTYACNMPRSFSALPAPTTSAAELYNGPFVARARALVDCTPSPYDREALRFKRGDLIDVISMNPSGLWRGRCDGRIGHFKFITVELLPERPSRDRRRDVRHHQDPSQSVVELLSAHGRPDTVEDLLKLISLEDHISVFVLNGYEELESFQELDESELDYLGIHETSYRATIMAAVEWLQDTASASVNGSLVDDEDEDDAATVRGGGVSGGSNEVIKKDSTKPFQRLSFPRDSGCFASNENLHRSSPAASDRSFHSGSQTESGIHLTHDDEVEDEVDDEVGEAGGRSADALHKRPVEQVMKTKALRDRHTITAHDLSHIIDTSTDIETNAVVASSSRHKSPSGVDKSYTALVEKYSTVDSRSVVNESKFHSARSVFEQTAPTKSQQ